MRLLVHWAVAALLGMALEIAWLAAQGSEGLAVAGAIMASAQIVLWFVVVVASRTAWTLIDRGFDASKRLSDWWARPVRERVIAGVLVTFVTAGVIAASSSMYTLVNATVNTEHLRALAGALSTSAITAIGIAILPGSIGWSLELALRVRPRLVDALIALSILVAVVVGALELGAMSDVIAALPAQWLLTVVTPPVIFVVSLLIARRMPKQALTTRSAVAAGIVVVAAVLALFAFRGRRGARHTIASSALQSRAFIPWLRDAAPPIEPGAKERVFAPASGGETTRTAQHLILITIDALRADHAFVLRGGKPLMPTLSALAERATRFDEAFCTVPHTQRSFGGIATGRYPNGAAWTGTYQVSTDPKRTTMLSSALRAEGFLTVLSPGYHAIAQPGFVEDFSAVIDPKRFEKSGHHPNAPRDRFLVKETLRILRDHERAGQRIFLWHHLFDPHAPYVQHDGFGDSDLERYAGELAETDRALADLLDGLGEILDDAIIVVTADHGEELGEHGYEGHGGTVFQHAIRVPLLVIAPDGKASRLTTPVSLIDIFPTALAALGLDRIETDGISLLPSITTGNEPPPRSIVSVAYPIPHGKPTSYAVIRDGLVLHAEPAGVGIALFDYRADGAEQRNLIDAASHADRVAALEADLARYRGRGLGESTP